MQKVSDYLGAGSLSIDKAFALKLYALDEPDRDWILTRLPANAKAMLLPLLQELSELGIELGDVDFDAISTLDIDDSSYSNNKLDAQTQMVGIDRATYSEISEVFREEPKYFFEWLSAQKNWSWKGTDIETISSPKVTKINKRVNYEVTPDVQHALMMFVDSQLTNHKERHPQFAVKRESSHFGYISTKLRVVDRYFRKFLP